MKKVLSVLLCIVMMLPFAVPAFAAEGTAITTADKTTVKPGDEIVFTVSVGESYSTSSVAVDFTNNNSLSSGYIWNTDVFEVVTYYDTEEEVTKEKAEWKISGATLEDISLVEGANAAWAATRAKNVSGEIFTFALKVKENAPLGQYTIAAGVVVSGNTFTRQGATVTVTHDCVPATTLTYDDAGHWYACTLPGCNKAPAKSGHSFDDACDTACNDCGYPRVTQHTESTGWTTDGSFHWKTCSVCNAVIESTKSAHTGGTATCLEQATCDICHTPYSGHAGHDYMEKVEAQYLVTAATCSSPAVYKKSCSTCGTPSTTETFVSGEIDPNGHKYVEVVDVQYLESSATCSSPAIYKKSCELCGVAHATETFTYGTVDADAHNISEVVDARYLVSAATCVAPAKYNKSCTICGGADDAVFSYGDVDPNGHKYGEVAEAQYFVTAATCSSPAIYKKSCELCGAAHATETFTYGAVDADAHNFVEKVDAQYLVSAANCQSPAIYKKSCDICGTAHTTETFLSGTKDENNHVNTELRGVITADCDTKGYTGDTWCKDCDKKVKDGEEIPFQHLNTEVKDKVGASCTAEGYTGDTWCKDCGTKVQTGTKIEKSAHTMGEWKVTKEATATEKGVEERKCTACDYSETREIPVVTTAPSVNTGDSSNLFMWIALTVVSLLTLCRIVFLKRRESNRA